MSSFCCNISVFFQHPPKNPPLAKPEKSSTGHGPTVLRHSEAHAGLQAPVPAVEVHRAELRGGRIDHVNVPHRQSAGACFWLCGGSVWGASLAAGTEKDHWTM